MTIQNRLRAPQNEADSFTTPDGLVHCKVRHEAADIIDELETSLSEAELQIEYLHEKFSETGSGKAVLVRARSALKTVRGE